MLAGLKEGSIKVFNIDENFKNIFTSQSLNFVSLFSYYYLIIKLKPILDIVYTLNQANEDIFAVNTVNGDVNLFDKNFQGFCKIPTYNNSTVIYFIIILFVLCHLIKKFKLYISLETIYV